MPWKKGIKSVPTLYNVGSNLTWDATKGISPRSSANLEILGNSKSEAFHLLCLVYPFVHT